MVHDHVYDSKTGAHIATIERGKVIDDITGEAIAEVRDGMLFGLDGMPWHCHLGDANGATEPAPMPAGMRQALGRD